MPKRFRLQSSSRVLQSTFSRYMVLDWCIFWARSMDRFTALMENVSYKDIETTAGLHLYIDIYIWIYRYMKQTKIGCQDIHPRV